MAYQRHDKDNNPTETVAYVRHDENNLPYSPGTSMTRNAYVRHDEDNVEEDPQPGHVSAVDVFANQYRNWSGDYQRHDVDNNPIIPAQTETIGTVTMVGTTTPTAGVTVPYYVTFDGTATDATYAWTTTDGAAVIVAPTGQGTNVTFNTTGAQSITCTVSSVTSTDSPVVSTTNLTVAVAQSGGAATAVSRISAGSGGYVANATNTTTAIAPSTGTGLIMDVRVTAGLVRGDTILVDGGSGWQVGDHFTIDGGNGDSEWEVTAIAS